ncbi:hypothetical protein BH11MYX3_BH11MYX3_03920 [soil metagenome]
MNRGLLLVIVLAGSACTDDDGPLLETVTPVAAARNTMVTLTGQRLCGPHDDCARAAGAVQVGLSLPQVQANVITYDVTQAVVVIPPLAATGATQLLVTVDGQTSNAVDFEVLP